MGSGHATELGAHHGLHRLVSLTQTWFAWQYGADDGGLENDQAMEYKDDYLVDEREAEMEEWRAHIGTSQFVRLSEVEGQPDGKIDHWHGDDASVYHVQGSSFARHLPPSF